MNSASHRLWGNKLAITDALFTPELCFRDADEARRAADLLDAIERSVEPVVPAQVQALLCGTDDDFVQTGDVDMLRLLVLQKAALCGKTAIVRDMAGNTRARDGYNFVGAFFFMRSAHTGALVFAAQAGHADCVELLLDAGRSVYTLVHASLAAQLMGHDDVAARIWAAAQPQLIPPLADAELNLIKLHVAVDLGLVDEVRALLAGPLASCLPVAPLYGHGHGSVVELEPSVFFIAAQQSDTTILRLLMSARERFVPDTTWRELAGCVAMLSVGRGQVAALEFLLSDAAVVEALRANERADVKLLTEYRPYSSLLAFAASSGTPAAFERVLSLCDAHIGAGDAQCRYIAVIGAVDQDNACISVDSLDANVSVLVSRLQPAAPDAQYSRALLISVCLSAGALRSLDALLRRHFTAVDDDSQVDVRLPHEARVERFFECYMLLKQQEPELLATLFRFDRIAPEFRCHTSKRLQTFLLKHASDRCIPTAIVCTNWLGSVERSLALLRAIPAVELFAQLSDLPLVATNTDLKHFRLSAELLPAVRVRFFEGGRKTLRAFGGPPLSHYPEMWILEWLLPEPTSFVPYHLFGKPRRHVDSL
jgi:hypothetical protein